MHLPRINDISSETVMSKKYETGTRHGREWAATAMKLELRRLAQAVEMCDGIGNGTPGEFVGICNNGGNSGSAIGIWATIRDERDHVGQDSGDLWEPILGEKGWEKTANDDDYASGFVEGCLERLDAAVAA